MIIGIKDVLKLFGISIVCFCAVFVCTFFLNFYLDASSLSNVAEEAQMLYKAQLATARFTCGISGGFLAVIAVVMLVFYVRLYISRNSVQLGILKAMGYSDIEIAARFWVFGASVFVGAVLGYGIGHAVMPYIYEKLSYGGLPHIDISFHPMLLVVLVIVPTVVYTALSCMFAFLSLKKPLSTLLHGKTEKVKIGKEQKRERSFLKEMFFKCVSTKKMLAFFVAFGGFCFSAMVQMSFSMQSVTENSMMELILGIGLVLAVVVSFMAISSLFNANAQNVSIMKAFGYGTRECALAVFGGFVPFAFVGFVLGTVYQYVLMKIMVNLVFADVTGVSTYSFDVALMFITFAAFVVFYAAVMLWCFIRLKRVTVKQSAGE